jgi:hypothetical protein
MSDRYTRKDAEAALNRLCAATGRRRANWHGDIGALQLDYAACYGGFVVHEVVTRLAACHLQNGRSDRCSCWQPTSTVSVMTALEQGFPDFGS